MWSRLRTLAGCMVTIGKHVVCKVNTYPDGAATHFATAHLSLEELLVFSESAEILGRARMHLLGCCLLGLLVGSTRAALWTGRVPFLNGSFHSALKHLADVLPQDSTDTLDSFRKYIRSKFP